MKTTKTKVTEREWLATLARDKTLRWFLLGSGVLLFATGLLKLLSLHQEIKFFTFPDPLLSFANNWQTSLGSALLEIGLALFLWFGWSEKWKLLTLTGTTLVFLAYRFGLYWIDYAGDCTCYGSLLGMTAGCVWFNTSPIRQA